MRAARRIVRGLGYVEGYGDHPGLPFFLGCVVISGMAAGWRGAAAAILLFSGPLLVGAWDRGQP